MTSNEVTALNDFMQAGMPGVTSIRDDQIQTMFTMFMEGYTYSEIAVKVRLKKEIILCLAYKGEWPAKKEEHVNALVSSINNKIEIQRLENANFIVETSAFLRKYFQDQMSQYNKSKDPLVFHGTNFKLLDKFMKLYDIMNGKNGDGNVPPPSNPGQNPNPTVSIQAAAGSTVNLGSPSSGSVNPGELLKALADLERAKEETKNKKG